MALVLWWTRPYALTGSHANGVRAWEQWERRTLTFKIQLIKTLRWYPDGALAIEHHHSHNGKRTYYAPNGEVVGSQREWAHQYGDLIIDVKDDPDSIRPFKRLIWWWNGW